MEEIKNRPKDYIDSLTETLYSEMEDLYPEAESLDERCKIIENGVKLASQITEAKKVQNDGRKTEIEANLKEGMNIRDNQTKIEICEMEIKQRKTEMVVKASTDSAIVLLNVGKVIASTAIWAVSIFVEGSGMVVETSKSAKKAFDIGKCIIKAVI
jgi:hypothetical protein